MTFIPSFSSLPTFPYTLPTLLQIYDLFFPIAIASICLHLHNTNIDIRMYIYNTRTYMYICIYA